MKEKLLKVAQKLGFISKINKNAMTSTDWDKLASAFKEEHGIDLNDALTETQRQASVSEDQQAIIQALTAELDDDGNPVQSSNDGNQAGADGADGSQAANASQGADGTQAAGASQGADGGNANKPPASGNGGTQASGQIDAVAEIVKLRQQVQEMAKTAENSTGVKVQNPSPKKILLSGPGTNPKYLFGIENDMFARSKRWNEVAASRKMKDKPYTESEQMSLVSEFNQFGDSLASRFEELFTSGQFSNLINGSLDYTDLENELGKYYQVRRQDAVIDYLFRLDSISRIFPVRYNVQDEEIITNVFEGKSYSQPFQSGRVFAGGFKFQPDKAKVKDVMFKYKFSDLKELERQYIGYLNTNGSEPIKWGFIEWIMVMCGTIQINEVEQRRVLGVRLDPTAEKPAHFMYASDGVLTTLDKKKEANQIYVLKDAKAYTTAGLLEYVRGFVRTVWRLKGAVAFRGMNLYMNELDVPDFLEQYREKYGKDSNYTGESLEVKDFPMPNIIPVPNMGDRKDMWMCPPNAVEVQENAPGEFMAYHFQRDFEELYVMSYKKEGTFLFAGRKFSSQSDLVASKGKHTNIFANNPVLELDADATTVDAAESDMFETVANTGATAITDILNASEGVAYKIVCGSTTNATTIAQADKFSTITAAYTPTEVGDYIKVVFDAKNSKFIELERKVGGTLAVNDSATAPEYVEQI